MPLLREKRPCMIKNSGVSAIESTTMAVILAFTVPLITPCEAAAENSTKANSPP